jgi:nucleoside-diphosphate kinase
MTGCTNGRNAAMGTIRGDYSVSIQENIIHTSDSVENAQIEIKRFFKEDEIFEFDQLSSDLLYANDEF